MPLDLDLCIKQNIHNRAEADIRKAIEQWKPTPVTYTQLKYDSLFADVMEDISDEEDNVVEQPTLDAVSDDEAVDGGNGDDNDDERTEVESVEVISSDDEDEELNEVRWPHYE